jgi:hypothetical protein
MEVEASVLQSSFILSDLDTSIPTLNIAEESIASTDIISIETVVTVSELLLPYQTIDQFYKTMGLLQYR